MIIDLTNPGHLAIFSFVILVIIGVTAAGFSDDNGFCMFVVLMACIAATFGLIGSIGTLVMHAI